MKPCSGVILAGGLSRRMGRDKAWVHLAGRPLIEHVIDRLSQVVDEIIVVTNDQEPYRKLDVQFTGDAIPGKGSLGGIYSGLLVSNGKRAVIVACDMPFLNAALLRYMMSISDRFDVVIPSASDPSKPQPIASRLPSAKDRNLHPLHAVYSKSCLGPIAAQLRGDDLRLIGFHEKVNVRVVGQEEIDRFDPAHLSLFNANSPEQLELAKRLMQEGRS